jgi:uncharacterized protein YbgA (DUF1722 family)/uncharacterized protein YbbK (DUF523 family)
MPDTPRPRVVVSRCLGFEACRYNGQTIPDRFLRLLSPHAEIVTVCPEVEIGLGTPRDPIHIVAEARGLRLLQPTTGLDLTERMVEFRERWLAGISDVDGFVLKGRSPSCGITDAKYQTPERNAPPGKGPGMFAAGVLARFPGVAVEDEGRLTNFRIREHFLARIFTSAAFRRVRAAGDIGGLVKFHAQRKLLLMAANQTEMRHLGRIVASHGKVRAEQVFAEYGEGLARALSRIPRYTSQINVLMHTLGYFKDALTAREKAHFLDALERYREGKIPLSAMTTMLRSWIVRFGEPYLAEQTWFAPYPEDLVEITDSGKGRGE